MDARTKEKWVAALRSGKFKQYRGGLSNCAEKAEDEELCCLGVLWHVVYRPNNINKLWQDSFDPLIKTTLIKMNDDEEKSFIEIASWIETNIAGNQ